MIKQVVGTASALGTVVAVEWRHSEWPPLATTTICNDVDVISTFWEHVSSVLVSPTTTGEVLLPLLRCEALGIRHRLRLGPKPGRDVSVLLKEFEEDFCDCEGEEEYAYEIAHYVLELEVSCAFLKYFWEGLIDGVARRLDACLGRTCRA